MISLENFLDEMFQEVVIDHWKVKFCMQSEVVHMKWKKFSEIINNQIDGRNELHLDKFKASTLVSWLKATEERLDMFEDEVDLLKTQQRDFEAESSNPSH